MLFLRMEMMSTLKIVLGIFLVTLIHALHVLILKPRLLREKLHSQGIHGPSPHFYFGNIPEMKNLLLLSDTEKQSEKNEDVSSSSSASSISHNWHPNLFPHFHKWRKQYGPVFLFSSGSIQWINVQDIEMVKEIVMNTSMNLGKPSFISKDNGPLIGQGILSSSGLLWAHQRKIIAPELYLNKVKAMVNMIVESTNMTLRSWESRVERDSEIKVDEDLLSLSADIIARACFGSNYIEGKEIFTKIRELQKVLAKIHPGIPGYRYLPNQTNRKMWRLEKEINSSILKLIKQRQEEGREKDLLQMLIEAAKNSEESSIRFLSDSASRDRFMIDNCKNIFFAGHETTAVTSQWFLVLLATHQDWQDRARTEVLEACRNGNLDADILRGMKTVTMVIQETLRLYPPSAFLVRAALEDVKLRSILIPKGMNIQIPFPILQQDPEIWGPDANKFNPERFANGVHGACKIPQLYMPFGMGPRVCVGQNLAMIELKIILSLILLKFRFTLSPSYRHSPANQLLVEPGQGVILKLTKI